MPVIGVVENMSGFVCPHCGEITDIFKTGGAERMASEMGVPFLGRIPISTALAEACDEGVSLIHAHPETEVALSFAAIVQPIIDRCGSSESHGEDTKKEDSQMRIAIPVVEGRLSAHFGHCQEFAFVDVDPEAPKVMGKEMIAAPAHQPGLLPTWLAERGADVIVAGGMGNRAQDLFAKQGIEVVVGAPSEEPQTIAEQYVCGTLQTGDNICDH